jgi:hypothetical protein
MKTLEVTHLTKYFNGPVSDHELEGLRIIRVPFGTFAGTQERLFVVQADHELAAFNTGDQAGGQN